MVATENNNVLVLYKVANVGTDNGPMYNAFYMPSGGGISLANVKQHCRALHTQSHAGADGFHWRVRVDDKATSSGGPNFTWWDIKDENAKLPIKKVSQSELEHMFSAPPSSQGGCGSSSTSASGAVRSLGKAVNKFAGTADTVSSGGNRDSGPRIRVIAFKLLDMVKTGERFAERRQGSTGASRPRVRRQLQRREPPSPPLSPGQQSGYQAPAPAPAVQPRRTQSNYRRANSTPAVPTTPPTWRVAPAQQSAPAVSAPPKRQQEPELLDFSNEAPGAARSFHHTTSSPAAFSADSNNETRAERLKREYEQKRQRQNRIWDEVDQRWVTVDGASTVKHGSVSAPPGAVQSQQQAKKKAVGIKLDASSAAGKSANVQAAVNKRVNEMRESQQKALKEVRDREVKKKQSEAEEDLVRKKIEPKIKAWSEEHGKKKQLRALLSSLHAILWPGANWKQVSLGDILDASKCKRCYHKASRVVHPDKTGHLDAEERFLAKRIFDALSQAKTEFDSTN